MQNIFHREVTVQSEARDLSSVYADSTERLNKFYLKLRHLWGIVLASVILGMGYLLWVERGYERNIWIPISMCYFLGMQFYIGVACSYLMRKKLLQYVAFVGDEIELCPYLGKDIKVKRTDIKSIEPAQHSWCEKRSNIFSVRDDKGNMHHVKDKGVYVNLINGRRYIIGANMDGYERLIELLKSSKEHYFEEERGSVRSFNKKKFSDAISESDARKFVYGDFSYMFIRAAIANVLMYFFTKNALFNAIKYGDITEHDSLYVYLVAHIILNIVFFVALYKRVSSYKTTFSSVCINKSEEFIAEDFIRNKYVILAKEIKDLIDKVDSKNRSTSRSKSDEKYKDYGFYIDLKSGERFEVLPSMSDIKQLRQQLKQMIANQT